MRKYIIGAVVGAALTLSVGAAADTISLLGKSVQGETEVVLNNQVLDKAVIIDGKSYAPTRSISEDAGYQVQFKDKKVVLSMNVDLIRIDLRIDELKVMIANTDKSIENYQLLIDMTVNRPEFVEMYEKSIEEVKQRKIEMEKELADLERQKAELEQ